MGINRQLIKTRLQISAVLLFFCVVATAQGTYNLRLKGVDRDSTYLVTEAGVTTNFNSRFAAIEYINRLPSVLQTKGYVTASLDSLHYDSTFATVVLFLGEKYSWAELNASSVDPSLLNAIGWRSAMFSERPVDFTTVTVWQQRMLEYLENSGYPFAKVFLDSIQIANDKVYAKLKVDQGPVYKIDSIRVYGTAKISNIFLQRYLDLPNGTTYSKEKLQQVTRKIRDLVYVEEERPSNLTRLGTGSVLNLYLKPRKSSQINVLFGFLPNNDQLSSKKLLVTGEANIHLRNAFGGGEVIGLNWQQIQVESPRLNFIFQYPYIFSSPLGVEFSFDMFKKDTTFLNVNFQFGVQYIVNSRQSGKLFIHRFQTIVNGVNKPFIIQNKRLPDEADVSSSNVGIDYEYNNTNYRLNPREGNELRVVTSVGIKKIKRNNEIMELKDPGNPGYDFGNLYDTVKLKTYNFRTRLTAAKYFPIGRQSTIKTAVNAGLFQSGNVFRNELFQIGGYKLLRGFDEESQYLSQFAIATIEYRLLVGQNSYFYALGDGGWGRNNSQNNNVNYTYLGTGLGIAFENKIGIFNFAVAVGKRNDSPFNLRQVKIHFGFVNYF